MEITEAEDEDEDEEVEAEAKGAVAANGAANVVVKGTASPQLSLSRRGREATRSSIRIIVMVERTRDGRPLFRSKRVFSSSRWTEFSLGVFLMEEEGGGGGKGSGGGGSWSLGSFW